MTVMATGNSAPGVPTDLPADRTARFWSQVGWTTFTLFVCWRIAQHAMWLDELQAWQIAAASHSPADLFARLRYEGHPGLWYILLWLLHLLTTDPRAMQGLQMLVAAGLLWCVWLMPPFRLHEKLLIACSYFMAFEYTVMSRSYGLGILLTLFAMGCWQSPRRAPAGAARRLLPWALLGLAANTSFYNAMLAGILGAWRLWAIGPGTRDRPARPWRAELAGLVLFGALLAAAMLAMRPADDVVKALVHGGDWSGIRVLDVQVQLLRTFLPVGSDLAFNFWGPLPFEQLWPYQILTPLLLWSLARALGGARPAILAVLALAAGTALMTLAVYPAAVRHTGMMFILFLLMAWDGRTRGRLNAGYFVAFLILNAAGGLVAMAASMARPFSQAQSVAAWFAGNHLDQAFIATTSMSVASPVAGYLRRAVYDPDCDCMGTHVVWRRDPRTVELKAQPLGSRLAKAMERRHLDRLYLIAPDLPERGTPPIEDPAAFGLRATRIALFNGANDTREDYEIFRIDRVDPKSLALSADMAQPSHSVDTGGEGADPGHRYGRDQP